MTAREGPSAAFGGWGSPPGSRAQARRRRVATATGLVACLVVLAAAVHVLSGGGPGHPKPQRASSPDLASAQTTVDSMSAIVAVSAADRTRVIELIDAVQSCATPASSGESGLAAVISDRRAGVAQLDRLAAGPAPGVDNALINDLVTTLDASISDDESYMSWMGDIAGGRAVCGGNPMSDPNFAAAKTESDRTNVDKQAFVADWDPLALRYGKPTYRAGDF